MGGSSSVRGDQTIYHTDNLCFDGTDRGSPMSLDGQLWIGSTTSDRANNGGHVRLGTLTAGTGLVVTNGAGSITLSTSGTSVANTITGNDSVPISPVAGNWNIVGTGSTTSSGSGSTLTMQLTGLTNHAVLVGAGTATITKVGPTATAGQVLQSAGAAADPSFSTATYPSSTTVSQILYSSATNTVSGLATANRAVLTTGATGIPVLTALATDGQLIIGSTAGVPAAATLTAGTGISIANASNSITINASGMAMSWSDTSGTVTAASNNGYFITTTTTSTLPAAPSLGDVVAYIVDTTNVLTITANTGQTIRLGSVISGVAGTAVNTARGDAITLIYRTTGSVWIAQSSVGIWAVV